MNRRELKVHVKQSEHVFSSYLQNCISNDTWGKRWPQFSLHLFPAVSYGCNELAHQCHHNHHHHLIKKDNNFVYGI